MRPHINLPAGIFPEPAPQRLTAVPDTRERNFRAGLICAVVVHAALIFGAGRIAPRTVGDPGGAPDALSVVLVDEADLASRETVPEDAQPPPGAPPEPSQSAAEPQAAQHQGANRPREEAAASVTAQTSARGSLDQASECSARCIDRPISWSISDRRLMRFDRRFGEGRDLVDRQIDAFLLYPNLGYVL